MKWFIKFSVSLFLSGLLITCGSKPIEEDLYGAWKYKSSGKTVLMIVTDKHYSITTYRENPAEFISTTGGSYQTTGDKTTFKQEFNTEDPDEVGNSTEMSYTIKGGTLHFMHQKWVREDDGNPGKLAGAWLITGRKQDGDIGKITPGARRTMKILSGKYFQWIAYNTESGKFFGTGGGSYTTEGGEYVENIEFFSRDNTRVGASLKFDFELKDGDWHHSGFSSKGAPLYEIWTKRSALGM